MDVCSNSTQFTCALCIREVGLSKIPRDRVVSVRVKVEDLTRPVCIRAAATSLR